MISKFFVYGTLKRGQCRAPLWPAVPRSVVPAWTYGHLYQGPEYPAMIPGNDQVFGELWSFAERDVPAVIERLDQIEGANQPGHPDLYRRVIAPVFRVDDEFCVDATLYLYGTNPLQSGLTRIVGAQVEWPEST